MMRISIKILLTLIITFSIFKAEGHNNIDNIILLNTDSLNKNKRIETISISPIEFTFYNFLIHYESTTRYSLKYGISIGYMTTYSIHNNGQFTDPNNLKNYSFIFYMIPELIYELGHAFMFSSDIFPTNAYQGPEIKLHFQTKLNNNRANSWYIGPEVVLKYLYYKNKTFSDQLGSSEPHYVSFTRNENALVFGTGLIFTRDLYKKRFFTQINFGVGMRWKIRDINTYKHSGDALFLIEKRPLGEKHSNLFVPTLNFAIKFGRVIRYKKNNELI